MKSKFWKALFGLAAISIPLAGQAPKPDAIADRVR